ncbi:MAG: glycosyltransferase [Candidatus Woesearchaeota archaeon]
MKLAVSIGIPAYNEEKNILNILNALLKQKLKNVFIKEIIVVSDGSTDSTCDLVKEFIKKHKTRKIKLIHYKERKGKWFAINVFLKNSRFKHLVLSSADVIPKENMIEELCKPLFNKEIGIVASHPIPTNKSNTYLGFAVNFLWKLHHEISKINPKFGETIAFKKLFNKINKIEVDEEFIAYLIQLKGLKGFYAENAIVYNHGPERISDYLNQRRRIFCGHLKLMKKYKYKVPTLNNVRLIKIVLRKINLKNFNKIIFTILIEALSRFLGGIDYIINKEHYKWEIAKTTKQV